MGTTTQSPRSATSRVPAVHVTLAMFDSREPVYRVSREGVPIARFAPLGPNDYMPSAMTPLRDAVAQFIGHLDRLRARERVSIGLLLDESGSMAGNREAVIAGVNEFVGGMREVEAVDPAAAGKVLAVIVTDGLENSSREVNPQALAALIAQHQRGRLGGRRARRLFRHVLRASGQLPGDPGGHPGRDGVSRRRRPAIPGRRRFVCAGASWQRP